MAIPEKFNKALGQVEKYMIAGLNLTLLDGQGKVLLVLRKTDQY